MKPFTDWVNFDGYVGEVSDHQQHSDGGQAQVQRLPHVGQWIVQQDDVFHEVQEKNSWRVGSNDLHHCCPHLRAVTYRLHRKKEKGLFNKLVCILKSWMIFYLLLFVDADTDLRCLQL